MYNSIFVQKKRKDEVLLLNFNNNLTDLSTDGVDSPHPVTNYNVTFSSSIKKYGTHSGSFNGTNAYLSIPSSDDFNFGTNDFTIDCWTYINSFSGGTPIVGLYTGNYNRMLWRYTDATNFLVLWIRSGYAIINNNSIPHGVGINTWAHVAMVRNSASLNYYVNGINVGSNSVGTQNLSINAPCTVGASYYNGSLVHFFNGYIDEFRIVKGKALWTSDFTPPIAGF